MENTETPDLIISLTTIPGRIDYFRKSIHSILNQTIYDKVKYFYINLDDNLTDDEYALYDEFRSLSDKIIIQKADHKWRSANKLIPIYTKHHDDIIFTFDDDKDYPDIIMEWLYNKWLIFPNCIISTETNPVVLEKNKDEDKITSVKYLNEMLVKLEQLENSKYLSNGCLFCPNAFSDLLFDYDKFMELTGGTHDELWFWVVSTLNNIQNICINYTLTFELDEDVVYPFDEYALSKINNDPGHVDELNNKLNLLFGPALINQMSQMPITFFATQSNILGIVGMLPSLHHLYENYDLRFILSPRLTKSWEALLVNKLQNYSWKSVKIGVINSKQDEN